MTATGFSTHSAADVYTHFTTATNADAFKADVSALALEASVQGLNDFDPATDVVARVTLVDTTTANTDMVDISALALEASVQALNDPTASAIADAVWTEILADHSGVVGSTAESLSQHAAAAPTESDIYNYFINGTRPDPFKADVSALALSTEVSGVASDIAALNDPSVSEIRAGILSDADSYKADVSGLATSLQVNSLNDIDAGEVYSLFTTGTNADAFKASTVGLATSAEIAALNDITANDVLSLMLTNASSFKADVSGLASQASIDALNDFDPATDTVARVTLVDTVTETISVSDTLTGSSAVTITVTDGVNPIENAYVKIYRTGEEGSGQTDANGEKVFATSNATYNLVITAAGYQGTTDSIIVSGTSAKTITLTATSLPTPSQPELCAVACYVQLNGQPVENATIRAQLVNSNSAIDGIVLSNARDEVETDILGYGVLELVRQDQFVDGNGQYTISVYDGNEKLWEVTTTIPNTGAVNLEDLV